MRYLIGLPLLSLVASVMSAAESVAESEWFALNLDPRPSVADTASFDYVSWLSDYFQKEDFFNLEIVSEKADPDGDGNSNGFEYLAKLDPTNRHDRLQIFISGESRSLLNIQPLRTDANFTVQQSFDLKNWSSLVDTIYLQNEETLLIDLKSGPGNSFYRLEFYQSQP